MLHTFCCKKMFSVRFSFSLVKIHSLCELFSTTYTKSHGLSTTPWAPLSVTQRWVGCNPSPSHSVGRHLDLRQRSGVPGAGAARARAAATSRGLDYLAQHGDGKVRGARNADHWAAVIFSKSRYGLVNATPRSLYDYSDYMDVYAILITSNILEL